ncbi:MAG TPA: beta-ketoacyl synthase N-terminal-like domain-containing protein [Burkholderiales bacterium]|nr:beta-ketoacyl synthase N-terminal-like domain-containing protein [Burkholderiales bacterium]
MSGAFVRACALASALGPDLEAAVERLAGAPVAPARNTKIGGAWPYFAIPVAGKDWRKRAAAIARSVAEDLRREAALAPGEWAALPCIVGSSSFSVGAWDEGGWAALEPPFEFSSSLAKAFGVRRPVTAVSTTCTSGFSALDIALGLVAAGEFREVLVLGVEYSNRLTVAGFAGLQLLSATAARPCDRERDGLVLGEALAAVLVSSVPASWRIAALATGMDAASVTGPAPDGAVIANAMRAALAGAHWESAAVDLIKLQSGGGRLADSAEANAVREVFAPVPRTVSLKGALGHTLGASGPAELALLLASLARGRVPATWGFAKTDEELGLAPSGGDAKGLRRVLFNLSGFGGSVMSLALEKAL